LQIFFVLHADVGSFLGGGRFQARIRFLGLAFLFAQLEGPLLLLALQGTQRFNRFHGLVVSSELGNRLGILRYLDQLLFFNLLLRFGRLEINFLLFQKIHGRHCETHLRLVGTILHLGAEQRELLKAILWLGILFLPRLEGEVVRVELKLAKVGEMESLVFE